MMRSHANCGVHAGLTILAIAAAGLLTACGPGQSSSKTTVVLTGPTDKVEALIVQYKLRAPPAQAHAETLDGGRERVTVDLPKGLLIGDVIGLGKAAVAAGVNYDFSTGTKTTSGAPETSDTPDDAPAKTAPARTGGPVV